MDKLKSRKFWVTLATLVVIVFSQQLGLDLSPEQIISGAGVVSSYLFGQSYVDRAALVKALPSSGD